MVDRTDSVELGKMYKSAVILRKFPTMAHPYHSLTRKAAVGKIAIP